MLPPQTGLWTMTRTYRALAQQDDDFETVESLQLSHDDPTTPTRRRFFVTVLSSSSSSLLLKGGANHPNNAVAQAAERAVGSGEVACRENNNCWQVGEWDGAVGWGWGGKDRCDAADPLCGTDGKLRTTIVGRPVPTVPVMNDETTLRFTDICALQIEVGRGEVGVLKLGLYGNEAPAAVAQLVDFLSAAGFNAAATMTSSNQKAAILGATQPAVSLQTGGLVTGIVPNTVVEFGVPSQGNAYARSLGRAKVSDSFVPQPRPLALSNSDGGVAVVRPHECAGLVSVSEKGLGYGGTGFESDDECYEAAFLITADAAPALDKKRRVIGQVLDADSMAFLERLSNIPTKRGIRGVIPGQTSGPPLPKVVVRQIQLSRVTRG
jgi:cyclophilin family peptidyl-prolyl cis-trans isomerase